MLSNNFRSKWHVKTNFESLWAISNNSTATSTLGVNFQQIWVSFNEFHDLNI